MLGVRRVGVSAAMCRLRERKLIVYRRGIVTILDHEGLIAAACGGPHLDLFGLIDQTLVHEKEYA